MTETEIKQDDGNMEDCAVSILCGSVDAVYSGYQKKVRETGKEVLELKDFWNRFRRRFPGSHWSYKDYGSGEQDCIGRAVIVGLRPTDTSLADKIDEWGWLRGEGHDAVLEAFIQAQEFFSGMPHPGDEFFGEDLP